MHLHYKIQMLNPLHNCATPQHHHYLYTLYLPAAYMLCCVLHIEIYDRWVEGVVVKVINNSIARFIIVSFII